MLMLPSGTKVWVATDPVNMNKSFDGLSYLVRELFEQEATSGQLFIFRNRSCDKVKVLYWDRTGFVQWYKRLEKGCFRFPRVTGKAFKLTGSELSLLLEGIDLTDKHRFGHIEQSIVA